MKRTRIANLLCTYCFRTFALHIWLEKHINKEHPQYRSTPDAPKDRDAAERSVRSFTRSAPDGNHTFGTFGNNLSPHPGSQRTAKPQDVDEIAVSSPHSQMQPSTCPGPEPPSLTAATGGKRPRSTLGNDKPRKKVQIELNTTSGATQPSRESSGWPQVGLPASNAPSSTPIPTDDVSRCPHLGGPIGNNHAPPTATPNSSVPSSVSQLGSVAAFTGRAGPRSALHAGSLESASVLETVKRLLERHCYRVSPFITSSREMVDVSTERDFRSCVPVSCSRRGIDYFQAVAGGKPTKRLGRRLQLVAAV